MSDYREVQRRAARTLAREQSRRSIAVPETGGPVPAFVDAVCRRALDRVAALLAHDVTLMIPPLHYTRQGARDVFDGLAAALASFGELRYDVQGRYLGPGSVTDEAVFTWRQTAPFLGAVPTGRVSSVPARVIVQHDEVSVTRLTLWPDLAALQAAVTGSGRVIDLTGAVGTSGVITALRATIPARQTRVLVGGPRDPLPVPAPLPTSPPTVEPMGTRHHIPKPPVPKAVRRRRTVLAGSTMLVAAGALASWVAAGALSLPDSTGTDRVSQLGATPGGTKPTGRAGSRSGTSGDAGANPTGADGQLESGGSGGTSGGTSGGDGSMDDGQSATALEAPAEQLANGRNTVIIDSDLLFATDSARLTPKAKTILADLITQARSSSDRHGKVRVNGFTDDRGPTTYNLSLSRRRAASVAAVLRAGLRGTDMTVVSAGYGESRPRAGNDTPEGRQANRRVTVAFPPPAA